MIDFRYHAISMVAVFLALAIGILLGVTIGDSLVSEAEQGLQESLQDDVVDARAASEEAANAVDQRDELIQDSLPLLAGDRLVGQRVAIVAVGSLSEEMESAIRDAVEVAGGRLDSVSVLPVPPETEALVDATGDRLPRGRGPAGAEALGRRVARALVTGGSIAGELRDALPDSFEGDYAGADAVAVHRAPPEEESSAVDLFGTAVLDGLTGSGATVVGVEASDTDPSQIAFYGQRDVTTVDSVDLPGGRAALVLALAGAEGSFGFKDTAEDVLPEPPAVAPRPGGGESR